MTGTGIVRGIAQFTEDVGALVEAHAARGRARDFTRYADDPVEFIRDVLHGTPWAKQEEIALLVRDNPLVAVRSANSIGKDWLAGALAAWWVYCRRGFVLVTGPTERQVKTIVMGEVHRHFARAKGLPGKLFEMALRLDEDEQRGILAFTSTEASRLTGFHAPRVFAILTEAQGLEDFAWEGVLSCATGAESRILALANPLLNSGKFFDVSRSPNWRSLAIPASEYPNVIARHEVIPGGVTHEWIERMAAEYGRESSIYRSRVLAEFPDDSLESLVKRSWLEAAAARYESGALDTPAVRARACVAALDPARYGADKSALAIRQGPVLRATVCWARMDTMETAGLVLQQLRQLGVPLLTGAEAAFVPPAAQTRYVMVDEIGLGAGVLDRLREQGRPAVGFNGSHAPEAAGDAERFANRRASCYWWLRQLLEAGKIALPRDPVLFDELSATQWKVSSAGKVLIEAKEELRARLGRSPDRADAVAMCFEGFARASGFGFGRFVS